MQIPGMKWRDMGKVNLPYVDKTRSKGRDYYYYRRNGHRIRLPGSPGTIEFAERYQEIDASFEAQPDAPTGQAAPGSIAALVTAYKASPEFGQLSDKAQIDYRRYLDRFAEDKGHLPAGRMERKHVITYRDKFKKTPRSANYMVSVIRLLMEWGLDRGWVRVNPASRPKRLKTGDGHRPWEEFEISLFRDRWPLGSLERTCFEIGINTGQRGEDIVDMERVHIARDGTIGVAQEKTGARVWIPQSDDLKAALDAWDAAQAERVAALEDAGKPAPFAISRMILTTETGRVLKVDNFRHIMLDAYKETPRLESGLKSGGVTTHGWRYTAATILHELGCDWETIGSITGHETMQMVKKYTEKKRRAKVAITRLNQARRGTDKEQ